MGRIPTPETPAPDRRTTMIFDSPRSAAARYGAAVLAIAIAALVRYWADSVLGGSGFSLFLAAVAVASWYGGLGPSLVG